MASKDQNSQATRQLPYDQVVFMVDRIIRPFRSPILSDGEAKTALAPYGSHRAGDQRRARFHVFSGASADPSWTDPQRILDGNRQASTISASTARSPAVNIRDLHHVDEPMPTSTSPTGPAP